MGIKYEIINRFLKNVKYCLSFKNKQSSLLSLKYFQQYYKIKNYVSYSVNLSKSVDYFQGEKVHASLN